MGYEKILCFMTYYDYFEFFYKILHHLKTTIHYKQQTNKVKVNIYATSLNDTLKFIYDTSANKPTVRVPSMRNEMVIVNYDLPKMQDNHSVSYLCPMLFTSLDLDSFFTIFCNLLIEHCMIFISNDLNVLTSSM
jgi:hypothetical protein